MTRSSVMIVDDDAELRELMAMVVTARGFDTMEAADGIDAMEQLEGGAEPSLILLDLRMPRMNGTEFLDALRHGSHVPQVPVLVITGDPCAAQGALEAGACGCLRKPIEAKVLLDAIRQALRD